MIDHLLSKLDKVQQVGNNRWKACCPAHDDNNPSLSVKHVENDKILLYCFAGCEFDSILSALGLSSKDLNPNRTMRYTNTEYNRLKALRQYEDADMFLQIAKRYREEGKRLTEQEMIKERNAFEVKRAYEQSDRR